MSLLGFSWLEGSLFVFVSQIVGTLTILYFALSNLIRIFRFLRIFIPRNLTTRYGKDSWVVVTGASGGIGKGFCGEFTKKGFNIVLISENAGDLKKADEELRQLNPKVQTKIIVADFKASAEPGFFDKIMKQLEGLDISILVNNVGIAGGGLYEEQAEDEIRNIVIINTLPMVLLTRKLIAQLNTRKGRSAIINLSSIMGTRPFPYFTMYSATKVFIDFFSRALAEEYPNIDIISLRPVYVSTSMTFNKPLSFHTLTPVDCAVGLIKKLGYESSTAGHWRHSLYMLLALSMVPDWLFRLISRRLCQRVGEGFTKDRDKMKVKTE